MSENQETSTQQGGSGELSTDILQADGAASIKRTQEDIRLISRAVRRGWGIPPEKRKAIIERMMDVVAKPKCEVMTKEGPIALDGPADANAVSAARVLVAMDQVDQTDHWNADKNKRLDEGKPTEISGIQVTTTSYKPTQAVVSTPDAEPLPPE